MVSGNIAGASLFMVSKHSTLDFELLFNINIDMNRIELNCKK